MQNPPFSHDAERLLSAFIACYRHSTLGFLVNGVAHNVNGVLQILSMHVELLEGTLRRPGPEAPTSSVLLKCEKCREQIEKLKALIRVLTEKAMHEEEEEPRSIHLNDLLAEEVGILKNNLFFKHEVKVKERFSSPLPAFQGRYVDFSQAFSNLLQNALEAMEQTERKELTLATSCRNGFLRFAVTDTGCGIPEEARSRLFEPFFTTKQGRHPGLGLFVARTILANYGASLTPLSRRGKTTFTVALPVQPPPAKLGGR